MRILHVVYSCVPNEYPGGVPRVVYEMSCAQIALGHDVSVFTTNTNGYKVLDDLSGIEKVSDGVKIHYFPIQNQRWFSSAELKRNLIAKGDRFDVVHSHNTFLALNRYAVEWSKRFDKPVFFHVHGALDPVVVNKGYVRRVRKLFYIHMVEKENLQNANGIFALTQHEQRQIRHYGVSAPICVVPNGVHIPNLGSKPEHNLAFRKRWGIPSSSDVVLYAGRIVPKKGLHLLIEAFCQVLNNHPNSVLVIAGSRNSDTEYARQLDKLVSENGVANCVFWTGFLNGAEMLEAWCSATIFCHVTESEGMAMSVLEAMAAGLPTVISDNCYMDEAVQHGALFESAYTSHAIASAIRTLLSSPEKRQEMSQHARTFVERNHGWARVAQLITDKYVE